jgi:hypothetical protein
MGERVRSGPDCEPQTAVGTAIEAPTSALSTTNLDFGSVPAGQSRNVTPDIRNSGGGEICDTVAKISPDPAIAQNASYCITATAFVQVAVRSAPSGVGAIFADIIGGGAGVPGSRRLEVGSSAAPTAESAFDASQ